MFKITYTQPDRPGLEPVTGEFASVEEFFDAGLRPCVRSWEHFNAQGKRTGGGAGVNAWPSLWEYGRTLASKKESEGITTDQARDASPRG